MQNRIQSSRRLAQNYRINLSRRPASNAIHLVPFVGPSARQCLCNTSRQFSLFSRPPPEPSPPSTNSTISPPSLDAPPVPVDVDFNLDFPFSFSDISDLITTSNPIDSLSLSLLNLPTSLAGLSIVITIITRLFVGVPVFVWARRRNHRIMELVRPEMRKFTAEFPIALRVKAAKEGWNRARIKAVYDFAVSRKTRELEEKYNCNPRRTLWIPLFINIPTILCFTYLIRQITIYSQKVCSHLIPYYPVDISPSLPSFLDQFSSQFPSQSDILWKLLEVGKDVDPFFASRLIEVDGTFSLPIACSVAMLLSTQINFTSVGLLHTKFQAQERLQFLLYQLEQQKKRLAHGIQDPSTIKEKEEEWKTKARGTELTNYVLKMKEQRDRRARLNRGFSVMAATAVPVFAATQPAVIPLLWIFANISSVFPVLVSMTVDARSTRDINNQITDVLTHHPTLFDPLNPSNFEDVGDEVAQEEAAKIIGFNKRQVGRIPKLVKVKVDKGVQKDADMVDADVSASTKAESPSTFASSQIDRQQTPKRARK